MKEKRTHFAIRMISLVVLPTIKNLLVKTDELWSLDNATIFFPFRLELLLEIVHNVSRFIDSGNHDMNFPHVGIEQRITSLNVTVHKPWEPFYVDNQIGGCEI